jgi:hypothetical protein
MNPVPEEFKRLACPNCKAPYTYLTVEERLNVMTEVLCRHCGEKGTIAYFTPAKVDTKPRLIERMIHVDAESERRHGDQAHVKAIAAAVALLAQAADEEGLELQWHTLRMSAARDLQLDRTTHVAVISALPRVHQAGGVASGLITPKVAARQTVTWDL